MHWGSKIHGPTRLGKALNLIFPKLSSQNMRGLFPVSMVSARNAWHNEPPFMSLVAYSNETNKAACVLTFSNYVSDAGQLLEILGWKDLNCQRNTQKKIIMVFKCLHGLALDYLALKFSQCNTIKLQPKGLQ